MEDSTFGVYKHRNQPLFIVHNSHSDLPSRTMPEVTILDVFVPPFRGVSQSYFTLLTYSFARHAHMKRHTGNLSQEN